MVTMLPLQTVRRSLVSCGSTKWVWAINYGGTFRWEANQPQVKEPLSTFGGTLGFHGWDDSNTFRLYIDKGGIGDFPFLAMLPTLAIATKQFQASITLAEVIWEVKATLCFPDNSSLHLYVPVSKTV